MNNEERLRALYDRVDMILERVPDNPIYDQNDARSLASYFQAIKTLLDIERSETNGRYDPPARQEA